MNWKEDSLHGTTQQILWSNIPLTRKFKHGAKPPNMELTYSTVVQPPFLKRKFLWVRKSKSSVKITSIYLRFLAGFERISVDEKTLIIRRFR